MVAFVFFSFLPLRSPFIPTFSPLPARRSSLLNFLHTHRLSPPSFCSPSSSSYSYITQSLLLHKICYDYRSQKTTTFLCKKKVICSKMTTEQNKQQKKKNLKIKETEKDKKKNVQINLILFFLFGNCLLFKKNYSSLSLNRKKAKKQKKLFFFLYFSV